MGTAASRSAFDSGQVGDTPLYHRYGSSVLDGELPYRDFYFEYPPGALPAFVLPALGGPGSYALRFKLLRCSPAPSRSRSIRSCSCPSRSST